MEKILEENKNKISIQRALTTIKLFEENGSFHQTLDAATLASNGKTVTGERVSEFEENFKKDFKSIEDKIKHIFDLKRRVHVSNMENVIDVPQLGEMTVAEIIIFRQTTLPRLVQLVNHLTSQYNTVVRQYEQRHAAWVKELNEVTISSNNSIEEGNTSLEYRDLFIKEVEKREPKIIFDKKVLEKYSELVKFFTEELDIILSEHNASTFISLD